MLILLLAACDSNEELMKHNLITANSQTFAWTNIFFQRADVDAYECVLEIVEWNPKIRNPVEE